MTLSWYYRLLKVAKYGNWDPDDKERAVETVRNSGFIL